MKTKTFAKQEIIAIRAHSNARPVARHITKVWETSLLPIEGSYRACDIGTKEEIRIPTGGYIHAIRIAAGLLVSSKAWQGIRNGLPVFVSSAKHELAPSFNFYKNISAADLAPSMFKEHSVNLYRC